MLKRLSSAWGQRRKEVHILVIGLDNSGKTSLIEQLKPKKKGNKHERFEVTPTVGFQLEEFQYQNLSISCFDMSGQSRYRSLWEHYYSGVEAIIFVLDSGDKIRMCVAKNELEELLRSQDVAAAAVPILFFANKMDLDDAMTPLECINLLELNRILDRDWHVAACNALNGYGVHEGLDWLADHVSPSSSRSSHK